MHLSSPASRRSTKDAVSWRTRWRPRRLGRGPMISSGRAPLSSSSTSSAPWCNPTSIVSRVHPRWLVAIGSATSFEVRGVRQEIADFTSFYLYSFTRGIPYALRARKWPRITRFDDRWRWLVTSVVPRFRRFDADTHLVDASLRHIFDEARDFASSPCVLPRSRADGPRRAAQPRLWRRPRSKRMNRWQRDSAAEVKPRDQPRAGYEIFVSAGPAREAHIARLASRGA